MVEPVQEDPVNMDQRSAVQVGDINPHRVLPGAVGVDLHASEDVGAVVGKVIDHRLVDAHRDDVITEPVEDVDQCQAPHVVQQQRRRHETRVPLGNKPPRVRRRGEASRQQAPAGAPGVLHGSETGAKRDGGAGRGVILLQIEGEGTIGQHLLPVL